MQSISDIKRRIVAVNKTRKITNAMYLLSASKTKKVSERIDIVKHYVGLLRSSIKDIVEKKSDIEHPYLLHRPGSRTAFIVVAADKGMAGGYNRSVLQFALPRIREKEMASILTVGKVANDFFTRQGMIVDVNYRNIIQNPTMFAAREIAFDVLGLYNNDLMDEVRVIYTRYDGAGRQSLQDYKLLPIAMTDFDDVDTQEIPGDMIYHPTPQRLFDALVPEYVIGMVFGALMNAYASENSERMAAMKNATDNADEIVKKLSLEYNLARQSAITAELSEIVGAAEAIQ